MRDGTTEQSRTEPTEHEESRGEDTKPTYITKLDEREERKRSPDQIVELADESSLGERFWSVA